MEMTKLDGILLSTFEDWAERHWAEGLNCEWDDEVQMFTDCNVQGAWEAYCKGARTLVESLGLGVDVARGGTAVVLMAKVKGISLVLKSDFVKMNQDGFGRVKV
jgi:hypothetical protein